MSDELKPCPFCGSTNLSIETNSVQPDDFHDGHVVCDDCDASGRHAMTLEGWLSSKAEAKEEAIEAWNRRTAHVSAPLDTQALPPLAYMTKDRRHLIFADSITPAATANMIALNDIAPYAERIAHLERELNLSKKKLGLALQWDRAKAERLQDIEHEREALAWAAFADNGNVIIWSRRRDEVEPVAAKYGKPVVPVIAYIDGRTAGTVPDGYVLVPEVPTPSMCRAGFLVSEAEHDPAGVYRAMIAATPEREKS
jgi:Lar family restriction alleviation protein